MRSILAVLLATGAAITLAALAGGLWAPFDSMAIVQPYTAIGTGLLALLAFPLPKPWRGVAGIVALAGLWDIAVFFGADPAVDGPTISVLQHNLHYQNEAPDLVDRLANVDIATFQESVSARPILTDLPAPWVVQSCPRPRDVTTTVATRLPPLKQGCLPGGEAWVQVALPTAEGTGAAITIVAAHLFWPWPSAGDRQVQQVARLASALETLPQPVLLGADLNQMPWSNTAAELADAVDGRVAGGLHMTFVKKNGWVNLPIDHFVANDDLTINVTRDERHGSDHHALRAKVGLMR